MKIQDKTWLACLIDTEGSILVQVEDTKKDMRKYSLSLRPELKASMIHPFLLEKAQRLVGGYLHSYRKSSIIKKNFLVYEWSLRGFVKTMPVIEEIFPYLLEKKDKAEVIIQLGKLYSQLIKKPLKYPRASRNQVKRKRLANRETKLLLNFLIKYWYPKFGQKTKSFKKAKKLAKFSWPFGKVIHLKP